MWIKPYRVGSVKWLFMRTNYQNSIPSAAFIHAASFDEGLAPVAQYNFCIGYRMWLKDTQLVADTSIGLPVLKVYLKSQGPFFSKGGKIGDPVFHPSSGSREWYVFDRVNAYLIRLETGDGVLSSNDYTNMLTMSSSNNVGKVTDSGKFIDIGPAVTGRSFAEWKSDLNSEDKVRVLACLTWLAGTHRKSDPEWNVGGQEPLEDFKTFQAMQSSREILDQIKNLAESRNSLICSQAIFTLEQFRQKVDRLVFRR